MRPVPYALALACAVALAGNAAAAPPDPTPATTAQARLQALEARVEALEAALAQTRTELASLQVATPDVAAAQDAAPADDPVAAVSAPETGADEAAAPAAAPASGPNAFNPAISVVLNGSASHHSLDPSAYGRSGFALVGEGGPSDRGLSLGESEVSFAANVDDKFYGQLTVAVESEDGADELALEEAYLETTALPAGLSVRAGRFFSNVGYLNSHHAHTDKFFDRPLPYQAFVGGQYGDDGVQLRWVAPSALFVELGAEVFRGTSFPGGEEPRGGAGTRTLFAHVGGDIGDEQSWLAGVSVLDAHAQATEDGFGGKTRLTIADATWKWAPEGNAKDGGITLRTELFSEHRDGLWADPVLALAPQPWRGTRRGGYGEAVWRINRWWEAGYRYDWLRGLDDGPLGAGFDPSRHTLALTWLNSEFSLLRLQYAQDRPDADDRDQVLTLQYQANFGAHGAHKF